MARLSRERAGSGDANAPEINTYVIELQFHQMTDKSDRQFFNTVPTSLQLPSKTVDRLSELAARELAHNKEFKRLLHDLGGEPGKTESPDRPFLTSVQTRNPKINKTTHSYGTHQ